MFEFLWKKASGKPKAAVFVDYELWVSQQSTDETKCRRMDR